MPGLVSAGVHFTTVVILIVLMPLSGQHLGNVHFFNNQMMLYAMGAAKTITLHVGFGIVTDF